MHIMTKTQHATLRLPFSKLEFVVHGDIQDESIMKMLVTSGGHYEMETMDLIARLVKRDSVCLDIGANIGVMSLAMSALVPQGKVFAFEALPQNFAHLQHNLSINGIANVEPLNVAIYDKNGTLSFDYVAEFAGGSFASETGVHDHRSQHTEVTCVTLDDWVTQNSLGKLDFVKMDIEGAEVRALAGAQKMLRTFKPNLIIECNSHALKLLQGIDASHLWDAVSAIYPYIYFEQNAGRSTQIKNRADFDAKLQWQTKTVVRNLLCSFKKF